MEEKFSLEAFGATRVKPPVSCVRVAKVNTSAFVMLSLPLCSAIIFSFSFACIFHIDLLMNTHLNEREQIIFFKLVSTPSFLCANNGMNVCK